MKNKFLLLFFLAAFCAKAQTDSLSVKSPVIVCKVKFGETLGFGDYSLKFAEVISDSRCPEKVNCVWAGEAKVLVEIQQKGKPAESKTLIFSPAKKTETLFTLKNIEVNVYELRPYPVVEPIGEDGKYVLVLILENRDSKG